jgi:hypothetical protein
MVRPRSLCTLAAAAALAICAPGGAAELTTVATAADSDRPFQLDFTFRYDRVQRRATISREAPGPDGKVADLPELRYERTANLVVARVAVGLYHDLELHAEMPYVFNDDQGWRYATGVDGSTSGIANNALDAAGRPCAATPCPIFPVGAGTTVYHGGRLGDLLLGLAWGIFSERRDDTKPTWVLGIDLTLPTAERYDPSTAPLHGDKSNAAPLGHKIWEFDFYTALSRQFGPVDPYVKVHARLAAHTGTTYTNCEHPAALAAGANCPDPSWSDGAGPSPPRVVGMLFGTELVAYESKVDRQRASLDLRVGADYVGESRWYNELSDATGKLLYTQSYVTLYGRVGLNLRASSFVQLQASAAFSHDSDHYLSGEPLGRDASVLDPAVVGTRNQNPNFDWRYDLPGRRFRVADTAAWNFTGALVLNF